MKKRIFFSSESCVPAFDISQEKITELYVMGLWLNDGVASNDIIFDNIKFLYGKELTNQDIENKIRTHCSDNSFIKIYSDSYSVNKIIRKETFDLFYKKYLTECFSNIQLEKIDSFEEAEKIYKQGKNIISSKILPVKAEIPLTFTTKEELEEEQLKEKIKENERNTQKELEKVKINMLYSLYFLQKPELSPEEIKLLIKIKSSIEKNLDDFSLKDQHRIKIHLFCIKEKIFTSEKNSKLKDNKKDNKKDNEKNNEKDRELKLDDLKTKLVQLLLKKLDDKDNTYLYENISKSFYLTTPLSLSCLCYVKLIAKMQELLKKLPSENLIDIKEAFIGGNNKEKVYKEIFNGTRLLTLNKLHSFIKKYDELMNDNSNENRHNFSVLYSLFSKYNDINILNENYSEENIYIYETSIRLTKTYGINSLEPIIISEYDYEDIKVELEGYTELDKGKGKKFVIELLPKKITEHIREITSGHFKDKSEDLMRMENFYLRTARTLSEDKHRFYLNHKNSLVRLLEKKVIENNVFYIFETQFTVRDDESGVYPLDILGTQLLTFALKENDFIKKGCVFSLHYKTLL